MELKTLYPDISTWEFSDYMEEIIAYSEVSEIPIYKTLTDLLVEEAKFKFPEQFDK